MTVFDHLRECAANGDTPTLDAARIVKTYDMMLDALEYAHDKLRHDRLFDVSYAILFARNPTL